MAKSTKPGARKAGSSAKAARAKTAAASKSRTAAKARPALRGTASAKPKKVATKAVASSPPPQSRAWPGLPPNFFRH